MNCAKKAFAALSKSAPSNFCEESYPCLAVGVLLTACAANEPNPQLEQVRSQVTELQNHPQAQQFAAIETEDAKKALSQADFAFKEGAKAHEVEHLAYLTERRVELARQTIALRDAEQQLEGFTSSTGSDAYNLQLSQARADSVRHALVRAGVAPERIQTVGLGKAHPVADNNSASSRAMNRRVEVTISHDDANVPRR